ncbi:ribokinase [Curtobacterium sp. MCBD17_021]|nr:ribokinase [Curtobacterium sp. MCBD17_021]PZE63592.1 ribokinase [Curtobacterium sp. MCBD17_021]
MGTVAVVGSLNADLVIRTERFPRPGETLHGSDLVTLPGGKSANQAVAAARLGGTVRMIGAVGDDAAGALLRDSVAASGTDTTHVVVRPGVATGTAVITVDAHGENTIVVSGGANATLAPADLPTDVVAGATVVVLCLEVPTDVLLAAARVAHEAGVLVLLNASPSGDVPRELLALTDVLLVNEHEAADLGDHGVARAIVTRGADGAVVHDGDAAPVAVPAVTVDPVDTTGCGDAFTGAVAVRLAEGDDLVTAARSAVGVGAYAATGAGAQASYPTTDQLEAFLRA